MSQLQPWIAVVGALAGLGLGVAGASWHWSRRLSLVQRVSAQVSASRNLLDQQNTQARRQIEQLQTEMSELRVVADRARRKLASMMMADRAAATAPTAAPVAPPRPTALEVAQMLNQNDQRRQQQPQQRTARHQQEDAGFEPTQVDPPDPL